MNTNQKAAKAILGATSRINRLDAIFQGSDHVNWWAAFRAGPYSYWLKHRFSGATGAYELWAKVTAEVADILEDRLLTATDRATDLKKKLEMLSAESSTITTALSVQDEITSQLKAMAKKPRAKPKWIDLAIT